MKCMLFLGWLVQDYVISRNDHLSRGDCSRGAKFQYVACEEVQNVLEENSNASEFGETLFKVRREVFADWIK